MSTISMKIIHKQRYIYYKNIKTNPGNEKHPKNIYKSEATT